MEGVKATPTETVRALAEEAARIGGLNGMFVAVVALNLDGSGLLVARSHNSPQFYQVMAELLGHCREREISGMATHVNVPIFVD